MNETTREFLKIVSDIQGNELETAAFNIREDSTVCWQTIYSEYKD